MQKEGIITKIISSRYTVRAGEKEYLANARGRIRLDGELFVGDRVLFTEEKPFANIEKRLPRKNALTRPYVANVDAAIIVIAKEPVPDFLLVDKILLNCYRENILPVLCCNKIDLAEEPEIRAMLAPYAAQVACVAVSAEKEAGLESLRPYTEGKTVCLAGQSAVGKTSLLNAVLGLSLKTDGLSRKVRRGKNTTRHVEIFDALGGLIIDTCGFSMLELPDIEAEELKYYYDAFTERADQCKVRRCDHIAEEGCAVRAAVFAGDIDKDRYTRYTELYQELKENRKKKYGA